VQVFPLERIQAVIAARPVAARTACCLARKSLLKRLCGLSADLPWVRPSTFNVAAASRSRRCSSAPGSAGAAGRCPWSRCVPLLILCPSRDQPDRRGSSPRGSPAGFPVWSWITPGAEGRWLLSARDCSSFEKCCQHLGTEGRNEPSEPKGSRRYWLFFSINSPDKDSGTFSIFDHTENCHSISSPWRHILLVTFRVYKAFTQPAYLKQETA